MSWREEYPENEFILQWVVDMLISAGYHRARLKTLNYYDKIIGGICWAISSNGIPFDTNINFKENANIGQKIDIAHCIVEVLKEIKCAYNIRECQIQQIYINPKPISNVAQWLIRSIYQHRRIHGDIMRNQSEFLYDTEINGNKRINDYYLNIFSKKEGKEYLINNVNNIYVPQRRYCKQNDWGFGSNQAFVDVTLQEYGYQFQETDIFTEEEEEDDHRYCKKYRNIKKKIHHLRDIEGESDIVNSAYCLKSLNGKKMTPNVSMLDTMDGDIVEYKLKEFGSNDKDFVYNIRRRHLVNRYNELKQRKKSKIRCYQKMKKLMQELQDKMDTVIDGKYKIKEMKDTLNAQLLSYDGDVIISHLYELVEQNECIKRKEDILKDERVRMEQLFKQKVSVFDQRNNKRILQINELKHIYDNDLKKYNLFREELEMSKVKYFWLREKLKSYPST